MTAAGPVGREREGLPGSRARWTKPERLLVLASGALLFGLLVMLALDWARNRTRRIEIVSREAGSVTFLVPMDYPLIRSDRVARGIPARILPSIFSWRYSARQRYEENARGFCPTLINGAFFPEKADQRGTLYAVFVGLGPSEFTVTVEQRLRVSLGGFSFECLFLRTRFESGVY